MRFSRKNVAGLAPYIPGYQPGPHEDSIKLNTNENPYPPSPVVVGALKDAVDGRLRLYPSPDSSVLRQKLAEAYRVKKEQVFCGNGCDEVISMLFRTFIDREDLVLLPYPTYTYYQTAAEINGSPYRYIETGDRFQIDLERFLDHPAKAAVIVNPNSPTGMLLPRPELVEFIRAFPGLVVVDETYIDFSGPGQSVTPLIEECDNLLVLRTFSKAFSLCGIRVGYAFGHPDLITELDKTRDSYNVSFLSQVAAASALNDLEYTRANIREITANREWLREQLLDLGFQVSPSGANFLFASHPVRPAGELYQRLAERRIYVRHFDQRRIDNHLRISVGARGEVENLVASLKDIMG
ncbi:MAG: histidinol-phosphate transaminase [Firmicutes bacterium]|nr:histidinol-phosphate transaminase [Bacillota bacterium]